MKNGKVAPGYGLAGNRRPCSSRFSKTNLKSAGTTISTQEGRSPCSTLDRSHPVGRQYVSRASSVADCRACNGAQTCSEPGSCSPKLTHEGSPSFKLPSQTRHGEVEIHGSRDPTAGNRIYCLNHFLQHHPQKIPVGEGPVHPRLQKWHKVGTKMHNQCCTLQLRWS